MQGRPDPQAERLIRQTGPCGAQPLHLLPVDRARESYTASRLPLQPPEPAVGGVRQESIPGPGGAIGLTVFRPCGAADDALLPGMVFFHGGGWTVGGLEAYQVLCRQLANAAGAVVIHVDFRLAPEHPFPAPLDDCWIAARWVSEHADRLGIDRSRIGLCGDSAGGNLAAAVALLAREAGGTPPFRFQVLIYPCVDLVADSASHHALAEGYLLTRETYLWYVSNYLPQEGQALDWRASPLRAPSHAGLPPTLVLTAGFDPLRDEGEAYVRALEAGGVPVTHLAYDGMIHGFIAMGGVLDAAERAIRDVAGFVRASNR